MYYQWDSNPQSTVSSTQRGTRTLKSVDSKSTRLCQFPHLGLYLYPQKESNLHPCHVKAMRYHYAMGPFIIKDILSFSLSFRTLVAGGGFEPPQALLGSLGYEPSELPLLHPAILQPRWDSNPHAHYRQGILSPSCLPIPPLGQMKDYSLHCVFRYLFQDL